MDTTHEAFADVVGMLPDNHMASAYESYKNIVMKLASNRSLLEIGAGRRPLVIPSEIIRQKIDYTANDAEASELDLIPYPTRKAVFDACGDFPPEYLDRFDVICSKMVQEHVKSGQKFYHNIFKLPKAGGIAINFHPTLYCPPFVINRILPSRLSETILSMLNRQRNKSNIPVFPATYELCYSTRKTELCIKKLGFSAVSIIPFYHHEYFKKFPVLRWFDDALATWAQTQDIRILSSYAYTLVKK
jgi:SAM-dependent methyltransferase